MTPTTQAGANSPRDGVVEPPRDAPGAAAPAAAGQDGSDRRFGWRGLAWVGVFAVLGTVWAWLDRWTCDDAWISFRYARNLVRGHGLVFNVGEWVEGYTNFAWTLFVAAGLAVGFEPDTVAHVGSLAAFACILVVLGVCELRWRERVASHTVDDTTRAPRIRRTAEAVFESLPLAPLLWLASPDARDWATGGLETAAFAALTLLTLTWTTRAVARPPRVAFGIGLAFAVLAMLRPDGVIVAGLAGPWLLRFARTPLRSGVALALGFAVLWAPFEVWRVWTYGELVPNTYYAKSAYASWWSQGAYYFAMFAERYALVMLLALVGLGIAVKRGRASASAIPTGGPPMASPRRWLDDVGAESLLFASVAIVYSLYVVKVGGDFMFARLFVPVLPLWCLLAAHAVHGIAARSRVVGAGVLLLTLVIVVLRPSPTGGYRATRHGVTDERTWYQPLAVAYLDAHAAWVGHCTRGLDASFAIMGGFAREAYVADMPVVIEAETGLTDAVIARQTLERRGRVGHEKVAPASYLVDDRAVDLTFDPRVYGEIGLAAHLPEVRVTCAGIKGHLLRWEPELVAGLRANGVWVPDYPARLDRVLDRLGDATDEQVRGEWRRVEAFYFRWTDDAARRARFEAHLARTGEAAP